MKPFGYVKTSSLTEASAILAEYDGKAKPVAGGTDIYGTLKAAIHPQYPQAVVDLKTIDDLAYIPWYRQPEKIVHYHEEHADEYSGSVSGKVGEETSEIFDETTSCGSG